MKTQATTCWQRTATHTATIVIAFGLILLTAPAGAGETFRFKGKSADAFFSSIDPTGCVFTDVFVFASDDVTVLHIPPGPPSSSLGSVASVFISQFDVCNGIDLVVADCLSPAPLTGSEFQVIGNRLDSATLNTTIECFDLLGGGPFDVAVALTWMGVGDPIRSRSHSHFHTPGFKVNDRFSGTFRSATASGSVSDGVTNYALESSDFAQIVSARNGSVTID